VRRFFRIIRILLLTSTTAVIYYKRNQKESIVSVPRISDAEWQVMEVLWARSPLMAGEVVDALGSRNGWSPRTVKTMLGRLVKKKALRFVPEGKRYLYRPAISREDCIRTESRSFVSRVFGGEPGPMLVHFVNESKLKPEEIRELKRILARKGK
jgi:BlaI family penicillinase repressor